MVVTREYEQDANVAEGVQQGVVAVVHRGGRFLMIRRAAGVLAGGAWCLVGGAIEPGETQPQAVVREFAEEVRGRVRPVRKVWEYRRPDGKLLLHWWLAEMEGETLAPNPAEVSEIRWCSPEEVEALPRVLDSTLHFVRNAGLELIGADPEGDRVE